MLKCKIPYWSVLKTADALNSGHLLRTCYFHGNQIYGKVVCRFGTVPEVIIEENIV